MAYRLTADVRWAGRWLVHCGVIWWHLPQSSSADGAIAGITRSRRRQRPTHSHRYDRPNRQIFPKSRTRPADNRRRVRSEFGSACCAAGANPSTRGDLCDANCRIFCFSFARCWRCQRLPSKAALRWQQDIETAKATAKQTGRLVLVHFWTPSCAPCLMLEQNVFNQPGVAGAIEAQFVPVKLNANENSATATGFGITRVPTDVILTPDGQVVGKLISPPTPAAYIAEMSQVANQFATKGGQTFAKAAAAAPAPSQLNSAYANLQVAPNTVPAAAAQSSRIKSRSICDGPDCCRRPCRFESNCARRRTKRAGRNIRAVELSGAKSNYRCTCRHDVIDAVAVLNARGAGASFQSVRAGRSNRYVGASHHCSRPAWRILTLAVAKRVRR